MSASNKDICLSCRKPGHTLYCCPFKKHCSLCKTGFFKHLQVVDAQLKSYNKLFFKCTLDNCCKYFKWDHTGSSSVSYEGQTSQAVPNRFERGVQITPDHGVQITPERRQVNGELSTLFKSPAIITDKENVEIDFGMNMSFRDGKGKVIGHEL